MRRLIKKSPLLENTLLAMGLVPLAIACIFVFCWRKTQDALFPVTSQEKN